MNGEAAPNTEPLRFSVPPYFVPVVSGHDATVGIPGESWYWRDLLAAPSRAEIRETLIRLRRQFRWPRSTLAAVLGVSTHTLRRWEGGQRNPTGAARRLVWLVNALLRHPEELVNARDLILWGDC